MTSPGEDKLRCFTWCRCRLTDLANHIRIRVMLVTFIVLFLHIHSQEKPFVLKIENTFFSIQKRKKCAKKWHSDVFFCQPSEWVCSYACYICHSVMPDEHSRPISCSAKLPAGRWGSGSCTLLAKSFDCHKKIITHNIGNSIYLTHAKKVVNRRRSVSFLLWKTILILRSLCAAVGERWISEHT